MSDDTHQESTPEENIPAPQEVGPIEHTPFAQERFGPFPEQPNDASSPSAYGNPEFYNNPAAYGAPPPYGYGHGYAVPPQGFYGRPPGMFQAPPVMQPATPLPLWAAIRQLPRQYWRVLTHPNAITFIEEERKAAWNIIWVQLLILGVVEAIVVLLIVLLEFFLFQAFLPGATISAFSQVLPIVAIVIALIVIVFVPISFFFGASIFHLIAKAFGGRGSFLSYCYNYSLILVPISILSFVLSVIPCLGSVAGLAGGVYEIVLLIFMTMGVHRLSGGKASATVLIPVITGILLIAGVYIAYFVWIFSMMPHN
ncbi:MAG TPA: YIP1 family protein [Ktedonobacteraceae bacterium]